MQVIGNPHSDATTHTAAVDTKQACAAELPRDGVLSKLSAYLDGLGGGAGEQAVRGAVYTDASGPANLVAQTDEIEIEAVADLGWIDLPFSTPPTLDAGDYWLALHWGDATGVARWHGSGTAGKSATDTYADGPAATYGSTSAVAAPALFASFASPIVPADVDDASLARLGFYSAQAALAVDAAPDVSTRTRAVCGWHGTFLDTEPVGGSFAIVQQGGPLDDLVGDRVRVSVERRNRSVIAYVHRAADLDSGDDISLTRRLYSALGRLSAETLDVTVEVMD